VSSSSGADLSGSFTYANPRTIHWGAGSLGTRLVEELDGRGLKRAFVISTRSVGAKAELGPRLREMLGKRDVGEFAGIAQHAPAGAVAAAVRAAQKADPDVLVSFGGGSPIDATKAVGFALATGIDLERSDAALEARRFGHMRTDEVLPHVAIPTTLSVAELSGLAGFTTADEHEKVGLRGEALIPTLVIFDAEVSLHTPLELWLSTGIRAVDHAVETLFARGSHPLPDTLALDALRRLRRSLLATRADPTNLEARTDSQLGAWFSFMLPGPAAAGLSHTLGKRIGSKHGIPHGVTSCLLLPHVMRYVARDTAAAQARIAEALGVDTRRLSVEQAAGRAADAVAELIARLGQPTHLAEYRLSEADLAAAVAPVASPEHPAEDLLAIFHAAW
jgi:alcohol dehydrogenase class IV